MKKSFTEGVDAFVKSLEVTDDILPLIVALQHAAEELDTNGVNAALLGVFGTTYRSVIKQVGKSAEGISEAEDFLNSL